jgi:DNA-binding PadR family transcriptional regulator
MTEERKLLLLGLLRKADMHGYLLNEHLEGGAPVTLKKPTAYNLLDRMERDGWIAHRGESTGDRVRKVYSVTNEGEKAFFRLLRKQLMTYLPNESPAIVSIGFLDELESSEALELLCRRRDAAAAYRKSLGAGSVDRQVHVGSVQLSIEYARRLADLDIAFLDEIIDRTDRSVHPK